MGIKLLVEFAVAIALAIWVPDVLITAFVDNLLLNQIFTVLWIVSLTNAMNLLGPCRWDFNGHRHGGVLWVLRFCQF